MGVADHGNDTTNPCRNSTVAFRPWPTAVSAGCGNPFFSDANGKLIMHFRAGSGTVDTVMSVKLGLNVPAGVNPGQYTGVLIVEKVTSLGQCFVPMGEAISCVRRGV